MNGNQPQTVDKAAKVDGAIKLTADESRLHNNGDDFLEAKYIFPNGQEAVYDGITSSLITNPYYAGTFNYINPAKGKPWFYQTNIGHGIVDVIPYCIGGNDRSGAGPACF